MMKKFLFVIGLMVLIGLGVYTLSNTAQQRQSTSGKISVVTTLFPQYDFTKAIGGDKVDVTLLLPPGIEAHAYEPKPSDILKINLANIFVYTGKYMELWADDIIESADKKVKVVDVSFGVAVIEVKEDKEHEHGGVDPHIWLDFDNAKIMAENITKSLIEIEPQHTAYFQNNLKSYQAKLTELDNQFKNTLSDCQSKTIVYGGHYTFAYMAKRYDLKYAAAQGFSPDAEPSAKDMIALVEQIKKENISYIFYQELSSPKIAQTLANETNTQLLLLNGAHNLSKENYQAGVTFISLMQGNLKNLTLALGCQK